MRRENYELIMSNCRKLFFESIQKVLEDECQMMRVKIINILYQPGLKKLISVDNLLFQCDLDKLQSILL